MVSGPNDSPPGAKVRKKLLKLTRKRLKRFVAFAEKFTIKDDAETIHDLRVWSRRLQQTLRSILPPAKTQARRKVMDTLRRVRQALGPCRNLDVSIDLARQRSRIAPSPIAATAWDMLAAHLIQVRAGQLAGAHKDVAKHDLVAFTERTRKLIAQADPEPIARLETALSRSRSQWDKAYRLAQESRSVANFHASRIATKRLRYRAELLANSSIPVTPMVKDLKRIQAALGDWHDRSVLLQFAGEFLARPNFLVKHPDMGGALLGEMEKLKQANEQEIENILALAFKLRGRWSDRQAVRESLHGKAKAQ